MNRKLILGTVQFGLQYGINSAGRPSIEQVSDMLNNAKVGGVLILDTSSAYGNAEEILGDVKAGESFKIVSKYPKCDNTVAETFNNSLKVLGIDCLYGYLLHHFEAYRENKPVWNDFVQLQKEGKVDRIGFSLYEPWELDQMVFLSRLFRCLTISSTVSLSHTSSNLRRWVWRYMSAAPSSKGFSSRIGKHFLRNFNRSRSILFSSMNMQQAKVSL
jgi:aryl-alcohol dehydrogenase-like predicted oxidoreductase